MKTSFSSKIAKLNQLKYRLRLDNQTLLTYIDSGISLHELELVLGSQDSIYSSKENLEAIERGMAKALAENTGKLNSRT